MSGRSRTVSACSQDDRAWSIRFGEHMDKSLKVEIEEMRARLKEQVEGTRPTEGRKSFVTFRAGHLVFDIKTFIHSRVGRDSIEVALGSSNRIGKRRAAQKQLKKAESAG